MDKIERDFFARNTLIVAKELLGNVLCVKTGDKICRGIIVETEAYTQDDPACHAYRGFSERSKSLFSKPGTLYVYLIYGIHYCANIATEKENFGSGVLMRALEPLENICDTNGPAKLCKAMQITKNLDGCDVTAGKPPVWLEYGKKINPKNIIQTTRIGISKAKDYDWRFYIKDNKWVSKKA